MNPTTSCLRDINLASSIVNVKSPMERSSKGLIFQNVDFRIFPIFIMVSTLHIHS